MIFSPTRISRYRCNYEKLGLSFITYYMSICLHKKSYFSTFRKWTLLRSILNHPLSSRLKYLNHCTLLRKVLTVYKTHNSTSKIYLNPPYKILCNDPYALRRGSVRSQYAHSRGLVRRWWVAQWTQLTCARHTAI